MLRSELSRADEVRYGSQNMLRGWNVAIAMLGAATGMTCLPATTLLDSGPPICNENPPTCAGSSICGQVVDMNTGLAVRAATPTARLCTAADLEPPCSLELAAHAFDRTQTTVGSLDDCGRFVVPTLDGISKWLDVTDRSSTYRAASHVINAGVEPQTMDVGSLTTSLTSAWLDGMFDSSDAILVYYRDNANRSRAEVVAKINTLAVNMPPTLPYAYYFDPSGAYQVIDTAAIATSTEGTALLKVENDAIFSLGGGGMGFNCPTMLSVSRLASRLVFVTIPCQR